MLKRSTSRSACVLLLSLATILPVSAHDPQIFRTTDGVQVQVTQFNERLAFFSFKAVTPGGQTVVSDGRLEGAVPFVLGLPDPSKLWDLAKNAAAAVCDAIADGGEETSTSTSTENTVDVIDSTVDTTISDVTIGDNANVTIVVNNNCSGGTTPQ